MNLIYFYAATLSVAAICFSAAYVIRYKFSRSIFTIMGDYFDPAETQRRVFKYGDPVNGEKFFGSTDLFLIFYSGEFFNRVIGVVALIFAAYAFLMIPDHGYLTDVIIPFCVWLLYRILRRVYTLFNV